VLAVLPFFIFVAIFLGIPVAMLVVGSLQTPDGSFTLANMAGTVDGAYLTALLGSIKLSLVTAVAGTILGLFGGYAVAQVPPLKRWVLTASGVLANFGGLPLAFAFVATLGNAGVVTQLFNLQAIGFSLYTFWGLAVVYLYFLLPLMILVIMPALEGLRVQWKEASSNLGATNAQFWRYVGGPVLWPSVLGGFVLLFGGAFAAYATAYALVGSTVPLITLQISDALGGNVSPGKENIAFALSVTMIIVTFVVMAIYLPLQRRSTKWLG